MQVCSLNSVLVLQLSYPNQLLQPMINAQILLKSSAKGLFIGFFCIFVHSKNTILY